MEREHYLREHGLITLKEAAGLLGITVKGIYYHVNRGHLEVQRTDYRQRWIRASDCVK